MNVSARFDVAGYGVIVTGGASGLGLAYGEVLAAHGARVALIDVDADLWTLDIGSACSRENYWDPNGQPHGHHWWPYLRPWPSCRGLGSHGKSHERRRARYDRRGKGRRLPADEHGIDGYG